MGDPGLCSREGRHGLPAELARLRRQQDRGRRGEYGRAGVRQAPRHHHRPVDSGEEAVVAAALADPKVQKFTEGKKLVKTILVPNKLVNLIAK